MFFVGRLVTIVAVFAVVGVSVAIGNAVGVGVEISAPLGLFLAGVVGLSLTLALGEGAPDGLGVMVSLVILLFAALGTLVTGKELWPQANALALFAGAIVAEVVAVLLLSNLVATIRQRRVRSRQAAQRRQLAERHGWRYEPEDADLPSTLGGTERSVSYVPGQMLVVGTRDVPEEARAYDVVSGEVGGVPFVAFDFFVPQRRLEPPPITTAWIARLPHALPPFPSAELFRDAAEGRGETLTYGASGLPAREESVTVTNPDYARAVMTDDVVALTRQHLPSWWVDGDMVVTTATVGHGAPPDLLANNVEAITFLATLLGSPRMAAHAVAGARAPHPG